MPSIVTATSAKRCVDINLQVLGVSYNQMNFIDHLPRAINQVLQLVGNDIVLRGLDVIPECLNGRDIIFTITPGLLIQDTTLIETTDATSITFKNADQLDALTRGRFVVHTDFQYLEHGRENQLKFGVSYVDCYGTTDGYWYHDKNRIVLDSFKVQKDNAGNIAVITSNFFGPTIKERITYVVVDNEPKTASGTLDGTHTQITYTAINPGAAGNSIVVRHIVTDRVFITTIEVLANPGGYTITVNIPPAGATSEEVVNAINNHPIANTIVIASFNEFGESDAGQIQLNGGRDADLSAENFLYVVDESDKNVILFKDEEINNNYTDDLKCDRFTEIYNKIYYQNGYEENSISLIKYICHIAECYCNCSGGSGGGDQWTSSNTCPCNATGDVGDFFINTNSGDVYTKSMAILRDTEPDPFNVLMINSCEFYGKPIFKDYSKYNNPVTKYGNVYHDDTVYKWPPSSIRLDNKYYSPDGTIPLQYLQVPYSDIFHFGCGEFTISFWVNFEYLTRGQKYSLISMKETGSPYYWYVSYIHQGNYGSEVSMSHDGGDSDSVAGVTGKIELQQNKWFYITLVGLCNDKDRTNKITVYVDGETISSSIYTKFSDFYGPINIGIYDELSPMPLTGRLADIGIWTRALYKSDFSMTDIHAPACSGYANLMWDPKNPSIINQNTSIIIKCLYGRAPYVWNVYSPGYSVDYEITQTRENILRTTLDTCGSCRISVTDSLGKTVYGYIRCTKGLWLYKKKYCEMPLINTDDSSNINSWGLIGCINGFLPNSDIDWAWGYMNGNKYQVEQVECGGTVYKQYKLSQITRDKLGVGYTWNPDDCNCGGVDGDLCIAAKCQRGYQVWGGSGKYNTYNIKIRHVDNWYYEWECSYKKPYWDYDNEPIYIQSLSQATVRIKDGTPPFVWSRVEGGGGFRFLNQQTNDRFNTIIADGTITNNQNCVIKVEDSTKNYTLGSIIGVSTLPIMRNKSNIETIIPNSSVTWTFSNGRGPFLWEVVTNNTDFTLQNINTSDRTNIIHASLTARGSAEIKVTDIDGNSFRWWIRSTVGTWIKKGYGCPVSRLQGQPIGNATIYEIQPDGTNRLFSGPAYQLVAGKYKLLQVTYLSMSGSITPLDPLYADVPVIQTCENAIIKNSPTCIDFKDFPEAGIRCRYSPFWAPYIPNQSEVYPVGNTSYNTKTEYYEWEF